MVEGFEILTFRNKSDDSLIEVIRNPPRGKNTLHFLSHSITHQQPKAMKKPRMKAIGIGSFKRLKRSQTNNNIIVGYWLDKVFYLNLIKTIIPKGRILSSLESIVVTRRKKV